MAREKILVIEDDKDIREILKFNLEKEGYSVVLTESGERGVAALGRECPDLIILDLMLPDMDGLEVCRQLKQNPQTRSLPVIMLTAKSEDTDIVLGLELGADDYITKPFSTKVLLTRIKTVLRRLRSAQTAQPSEQLKIYGVEIDRRKYTVAVNGKPIKLSNTEFNILVLLAAEPGRVFSRTRIIDALRGSDYSVTERTIDVQILGLRKKLAEAAGVIETIRGVGYRVREENHE